MCALLFGCSALKRADAIVRVVQLASEGGKFLLLRLCLTRYKCRNRKVVALLGARGAGEGECRGRCEVGRTLRV